MFMFIDSIHPIEGWIESMNMNKEHKQGYKGEGNSQPAKS